MVFWGRGGVIVCKKIPSNAHWMQHWVRVTGQDLGGSWLVSDQLEGEMEDLGSGRIQAALERAE